MECLFKSKAVEMLHRLLHKQATTFNFKGHSLLDSFCMAEFNADSFTELIIHTRNTHTQNGVHNDIKVFSLPNVSPALFLTQTVFPV